MPQDDNGFAVRNLDETSTPASSAPAKKPDWKVRLAVVVEVPVPRLDAPTPDHAIQFAKELASGLPLQVSLGGVPLKAAFQDAVKS